MKDLIRIQGKVVQVEPARTIGYYIVICEQETNKQWGAFSQWRPRERTYAFTLRQDSRYFFVVNWQELATNPGQVNNVELNQKTICQSNEVKDKQAEQQAAQKFQAKIKQLEAEAQQWKNAYYNQKWMLKQAQENAYQRTVYARIQAIKNKPGRKSKQDLDYLKLLGELSQEHQENWSWLNAD